MLVLTRNKDESIDIGDGIKVSVLGVRGGRVIIGVEAPSDVPVMRTEAKRPEK